MVLSRFAIGVLSISLMVLGAGAVYGQDYPNKPIRIITTPVGGGGDFVSRQIAQGISGTIGQPVIVENRASLMATETVAKAPPDGYTLHITGPGLWIRPLLAKMPYDPVRDFSPILLVAREVNIIAVHPSLPVKSVKELIALAKAKPGALDYSSGSTGSSTHLAGELFKFMAGVNMVHIAYKGTAPGVTALLSGEVQLTIIDAGHVVPHVKSGRLRALAVTSAEPSALAPGLPTVAATGLPGYEATGMTGVWAPAKTPGTIINRLNQEIMRFINLPEVKERFLNSGEEIVGSSPEQFAATIKSDAAKWDKVIKAVGVKLE